MWLPVDINKACEIEKGIRDAFLVALQNQKFTYVIESRKIVNRELVSLDLKQSQSIFERFCDCSLSFVGTSKLVSCPPFVAFTVAEELGIAYIEHLIDLENINDGKVLSGFSRGLIEVLCFLAFKENSSIDTISIPFLMKQREIPGYKVSHDGHFTKVSRCT